MERLEGWTTGRINDWMDGLVDGWVIEVGGNEALTMGEAFMGWRVAGAWILEL